MRNSSRILGSTLDVFATRGPQSTTRRSARLPRQVRRAQVSLIHSCTPSQTWRVDPPKPPSVHPHASRSVSLPLPEQLRGLMRLMTHSVVVCTSALPANTAPYDYDYDSPDGGHYAGKIHGLIGDIPVPRAMTMSSFTSLALSPVPVVTFNIAVPSRTLDAVAGSERFNIHILSGDGRGASIANRFSQGNNASDVFPALDGDDTCEVAWSGESEDPPILRGDGVLYILRCRLLHDRGTAVEQSRRTEALVRVKDHVIVLGEVMEILEGEGRAKEDKDEKFGLVYSDRKYRLLGNVLRKVPH